MTTATKRAKGRKAGPRAAARVVTDSGKNPSGPIPVGARVRIAYRPEGGVWDVRREMLCGATRYLVLAQDGFHGYPCVAEEHCELVETVASVPSVAPVVEPVRDVAPVGLWEQAS